MAKYIRINNATNIKIQGVKQKLSELGVSFDVFDYSAEVFFNEEAEHRLDLWEEDNGEIKDKDLRNEILGDLENKYFDDDYIISGDALCDITRDVVESHMNKISKANIAL